MSEEKMMGMTLLDRLRACPVDFRHALALLDDGYREWRPEGKRPHELTIVAGATLLTIVAEGVAYLLEELSEDGAAEVAAFVAGRKLNELHVSGEASFRRLRHLLTDGQWRLSRNYELSEGEFRPRPSPQVRLLTREDRGLLEAACAAYPVLTVSRSTMRDFDYMMAGLPVACYGAFAEGRLVGFCSANPMCNGITEIGWIVVAEAYRRRGFASGFLTAQAREAFAQGNRLAYYAGSAGEDLHAMLMGLGFREVKGSYRFIPASAVDQWRTNWGRTV